MSKSTRGIRAAGVASLAVSLSLGVAAPAFAVPDFAFDRIGGEDRYQTAADIADEYRTVNPDVVLANGQPGFYADALSGNYLAGELDAPILLTNLKRIPQYTLDQLDQMGAENIRVIGGEGVVPPAQVQQLRDAGYTVERIAGDDRFLTNAEVIEAGGAAKDGLGVVATGFDFPDALGGGPLTYQGHPVGLSSEDDIKQAVIDALKGAGVDEVLILGGEAVVGPEVAAKLTANGITVRERLAGANRSGTAAEVAEYAVANLGFSDTGVNVASGYTEGYGADALAGGPLTGQQDRPMLITRNVDNPGAETLAYLRENCDTLVDGVIFGQTGALSEGAEADMNGAASCAAAPENPSNQTVTSRPELVNAQIVSTNASGPNAGTTIRYTFDENITGKDPVNNLFYAYFYDGTNATSTDAIVDPNNSRAVLAQFPTITSATEPAAAGLTGAESLRVATVDYGAVADDTFSSTGPRAENPIGDAQLAAGSDTPGGSTGFQAGVTAAPDLLSVTGFTQVPGQNRTVVTFTFDEAATLVNFTPSDGFNDGFHLVLQDGATDLEGAVQNGNGTTSIEVVFDSTGTGGLTAANVARGYIEAGTVSDDVDDATVDYTNSPSTDPEQGNLNPLQAADAGNSGNSSSPDLVSATLGAAENTAGETTADYIDYKFDEPVTALVVAANFGAYDADGDPITSASPLAAQRSTADNTVVRVTFADNDLASAVGAFVEDGAVNADDGAPTQNQEDEVGLANSNTNTGAGASTVRTEGPDLTGVAVNEDTDVFGTPEGTFTATYSFDEKLSATIATPAGTDGFQLVLANGDILDASSCEVDMVPDESTPAPGDTTTSNTVTCDAFTGTAGQPGQAVLGTVDNDLVNDTDGGEGNPEGAAVVS